MNKIIAICVAALLLGCNLPHRRLSKAKQQFVLNVDSFAYLTQKYFPCLPAQKVDTVTVTDSRNYEAAVNELNVVADEYARQVQALQGDSTNKDEVVKLQQAAISALQNRLNHLPPIVKEIPKPYAVIDSAHEQVWRNIQNQLEQRLFEKEATIKTQVIQNVKNDTRHEKDIWWKWLCIGTWALIVVFLIGRYVKA